MANQQHLDILKQGVDTWNEWREEHPDIIADLGNADLRGADLCNVDLSKANLREADLSKANLREADLSEADLRNANLREADLRGANLRLTQFFLAELHGADFTGAFLIGTHFTGVDLTGINLTGANLVGADFLSSTLTEANLSGADLRQATLTGANLSRADLHGANLMYASISRADLRGANLTGCSIYALSGWDVQLEDTLQSSLIITRPEQPTVTVDQLEVAQFIYLLLNNQKIRDVIDTITSKVVLILGRFTDEQKKVLDALRDELGKHNYTPVIFDFEKPSSRDFTETVSTLAHLARFIIADLTEPSSIPQELQAIVPDLKVPVQPLLQEAKREYAMFIDFRKYPWVLPIHFYKDQTDLLESLQEKVIRPAEQTAQNYEKQK